MAKSVIFISSTIQDFRDLRSALKYWLENLGYEVLLSEFNDFTKPLDENSFNACLKAVERADYFVLLVGSRVGAFFHRREGITVTRMEYRTAYQRMLAGKTKLVSFVRRELWDVREDRKALKDFLESEKQLREEIDDAKSRTIVNHPSSFANEASFTFEFLDEIGKKEELERAINDQGAFPIGNWIHTFSTFEDIVEVLRTEFNISDNLSKVALTINLKREILSNLSLFLEKEKGGRIGRADIWPVAARRYFQGDAGDSSSIPGEYLRWLVIYAVLGRRASFRLSTQFVDQAMISGEFLQYRLDIDKYESSPIHDALVQLKEYCERLKFSWSSPVASDIFTAFFMKYCHIRDDVQLISVPNIELLELFSMHDCADNVVNLCVALLKALEGDYTKLENLTLKDVSPLAVQAEKIKESMPNLAEVDQWANIQ